MATGWQTKARPYLAGVVERGQWAKKKYTQWEMKVLLLHVLKKVPKLNEPI